MDYRPYFADFADGPWRPITVLPSGPVAAQAVRVGRAASPFGEVWLLGNAQALLYLGFLDPHDEAALRAECAHWWPATQQVEDSAWARQQARALFGHAPVTVQLPGTPFQQAVWQQLLRIPAGAVVRYGDVARAIGRPRAVRAVGQAVGANPLPYVFPCHRVLPADGSLGHYGSGPARKRAMLSRELPATGVGIGAGIAD